MKHARSLEGTPYLPNALDCLRVPPQLTRNEQKIFDKLKSLGRAVGAYELLDLLRSEGVNAIPTIYRALNGLIDKGIVYHIASTKTFVAHNHDDELKEGALMMVCTSCHHVCVQDAAGLKGALECNAASAGFQIRSRFTEITGLCYACREQRPTPGAAP